MRHETQQYTVYDPFSTLPVTFGTASECAAFLGITPKSFREKVSKQMCGKVNGRLTYIVVKETQG